MVGLTVIVAPFPATVPPQLPPYHCQDAFVPRLPPVIDSVVLWLSQIVPADAVSIVAGAEG